MDKEASPEAKFKFRENLKRWKVPDSHFKVLEVIFRQTMMSHDDTKYRYNNDHIDKNLHKNVAPEIRFNNIQNYIKNWESNTGLEYGFEKLHINELDQLDEILKQYEFASEQIRKLGQRLDAKLGTDVSKKTIADIQKQIKTAYSINGRKNERFLSFNSNGKPKRADINHDYFVRYLTIGYAVFYDYFDAIGRRINDENRLGNHFNRFLSYKVQREHVDLIAIGDLDPEKVKDRLKNNSEGRDKRHKIPRDLGLIDDAFIDYLISNNAYLPK